MAEIIIPIHDVDVEEYDLLQISLMLKKEAGTPVFDGGAGPSWSKEIED